MQLFIIFSLMVAADAITVKKPDMLEKEEFKATDGVSYSTSEANEAMSVHPGLADLPLDMFRDAMTYLKRGANLHEVSSAPETPDNLPLETESILALRTDMFEALKATYLKLQSAGIPVFPRNGLLLSIVRDQGFLRSDFDTDMAILDIHWDKLVAASKNVDFSPYVLILQPRKQSFTFYLDSGLSAGKSLPWPVMDGAIWNTKGGTVVPHNVSMPETYHHVETALNGFPIADWDTFETMDFYCLPVKVPRGYGTYLTSIYGEDWAKVAKNKCSGSGGSLYKSHPKQCRLAAYAGAKQLPVEMGVGRKFRGEISNSSCVGGQA